MRTISSRTIFTKKCRQQQNFDSDPKEAWHYNQVTFTPIAQNFMLYCRLIYMLSMLYVTIKVKVGIPESRMVPPQKKLGRVTLTLVLGERLAFRYLHWVFMRKNLEFTAVNEWNPAFCGSFPVFYETVNTAESCKNACILAFSDRLPLGELRIITTFASSFLAFSFISRDTETSASGKWSIYFVIL